MHYFHASRARLFHLVAAVAVALAAAVAARRRAARGLRLQPARRLRSRRRRHRPRRCSRISRIAGAGRSTARPTMPNCPRAPTMRPRGRRRWRCRLPTMAAARRCCAPRPMTTCRAARRCASTSSMPRPPTLVRSAVPHRQWLGLRDLRQARPGAGLESRRRIPLRRRGRLGREDRSGQMGGGRNHVNRLMIAIMPEAGKPDR